MSEIWSNIIIALISFAGTALGSWNGIRLISYRLEQLEKKVDKQSDVAERIPVFEEQLRSMDRRLLEVEHGKAYN